MDVKIKKIHFEGLNCYNAAVISVASSLGCEYELAFSESWGFEFIDRDDVILGNKISTGERNFEELLERYHGVKLSFYTNIEKDSILDIIIQNVNCGVPIIVFSDAFWCPWDESFQKHHHRHVFIIQSYNLQTECFICSDPWYLEDNLTLCSDFLKKGINIYVVAKLKNIYINNIDWKDIIINALKRLKSKSNNLDSFSMIRLFGNKVKDELCIDSEFEEQREFYWFSPLFRNLEEIARGRLRFARLLDYLAEKYEVPSLKQFSNELTIIATKWSVIKSLITKAYISHSSKALNQRISEKIKEIADLEESLYISLYSLVTRRVNRHSKPDINVLERNKRKLYFKNYIYRNILFCKLDSYFNNKAFGNISDNYSADLTGIGEYFISDGLLLSSDLNIDSLKFRFVSNNKFDNIACQGQRIHVPRHVYNSIMILATAEFGNYTESLKLVYEHGKTITIQINFTDWYRSKPLYDECIAWSGKVYSKVKKAVSDNNYNIYAIRRPFEEYGILKSIILPQCPNIHIFAISLSYRS